MSSRQSGKCVKCYNYDNSDNGDDHHTCNQKALTECIPLLNRTKLIYLYKTAFILRTVESISTHTCVGNDVTLQHIKYFLSSKRDSNAPF